MGYSFFGVFDSEGLSFNHFKVLEKAIKPTKCRIKLKNKSGESSSRCTGIRALYGLKGKPLQNEIDKATKKLEGMSDFTYKYKPKYQDGCWIEDHYDRKNIFGIHRTLKSLGEISKRNPKETFGGD